MEKLISVIVPVYNTKLYLKKCIKSIMEQTYSNIEIILIDDGSTDGSAEICDNFALEDNRIKVIHQKNEGVTAARKTGLSIANGEYIGFVDADDWIEKKMYEELYRHVRRDGSQVVVSNMYLDNESGTYMKMPLADINAGVYSGNKKKTQLDINIFSISGSLVCTLFEAKIIKRNMEKVDSKIYYYEDIACVLPCVLEAKIVTVIDDAFYHGFERYNSATHVKHDDWYEQLNLVYLRLKEVFQSYSHNKELLSQLQEFTINNIFYGIEHLFPTIHFPNFYWSENIVHEKRKVILYGAGRVGRSYFEQFNRTKQYDVILWVDMNADYYRQNGYNVSNIEEIVNVEFDKIILALKRREVAEDVKLKLLALGIKREQIIWKRPLSLYEYFLVDEKISTGTAIRQFTSNIKLE